MVGLFLKQKPQKLKKNSRTNITIFVRYMKTRDINLPTVKLQLNRAAIKSPFNKDEQRV